MNLKPIASNMTELKLNDYIVLFSYETLVAAIDRRTKSAYQTEKKWSTTTTRHINKWLGMHPEVLGAQYKPQEYFDNLISEVK